MSQELNSASHLRKVEAVFVYCILVLILCRRSWFTGSSWFPWGSVWLTRWDPNFIQLQVQPNHWFSPDFHLLVENLARPINPSAYPYSRCPKFQNAQLPRTAKRGTGKPPMAWIHLLRVILVLWGAILFESSTTKHGQTAPKKLERGASKKGC